LGLPVKWKSTEDKHKQIGCVAKEGKTYEVFVRTTDPNGNVKFTSKKVDFIKSTKDKNPMPGTNSPAAVRYQRYIELADQGGVSKDFKNEELAVCMTHGDYVSVQSLQSDHLIAKSEIYKRQLAFIDQLNKDKNFAAQVKKLPGMGDFFIEENGTFYGTLFFYELYFNDIENIWLICSACNLEKSDQDTVDWLTKKWTFGEQFLEYLGNNQHTSIADSSKNKKGLAELAINWFWMYRARYVDILKRAEGIKTHLMILNREVEYIFKKGNTKRAERKQASLEAKTKIVEGSLMAKVGKPKTESEETASDTDSQERLVIKENVSTEEYLSVAEETGKELKETIEEAFSKKLVARIRAKEHERTVRKRDELEKKSDDSIQDKDISPAKRLKK